MKIGIISLVLHTNYGGILQSYALQTVLERMGHEVVVLTRDRDIHISLYRLLIRWSKTFVKKYLLRKEVSFFNPWKLNADRHEREQYTGNFINQNIHTRVIRELTSGIFDDMDAVLVGSDQVWRPNYFKYQWRSTMGDAFLKFQEHSNVRRIAYAVSFGTDEWEYSDEETAECSTLLNKFDAVSVRELSGVDLCKSKLCYDYAQHVLDPTFLLDKEDYIRLVEKAKTPQSPGNMMCHILDMTDEKLKIVDRIVNEWHLSPFYTNSKINDKTAKREERIQPPIEQWLRGFMDAEFVVTDSYHACVFSIIFEKPFVAIGNEKRGMTRFDSLLSAFHLEDHLIHNDLDILFTNNYVISQETKERLMLLRQNSMQFLEHSLKKK
jgi:hypothetical protein